MKKLFTLCLAVLLVLTMGTAVCAASGSFVSSPSNNGAPKIIHFAAKNADCDAELVITPYRDRNTLTEEQIDNFEQAYADIAGTDDLTELTDELADLAKKKNIDGKDLAVSDLFYASQKGCVDHDNHFGFEVILDAGTLRNYVGLMQMDKDGNWSMVNGAFINDDGYLEFTLESLDVSLAIVVNGANVSPQTGDSNEIFIYGALMVVSALAIVVIAVQNKKHA